VFWGLAMILGVCVFFLLYMFSNLSSAESIVDFFTGLFWASFGWMVLLCFVADYGGKIIAFGLIKWIYKRPKSNFREVNEMNLGTFVTHLFEVLLRALIFMIGAVRVIQSQLFTNDTSWSLIMTYLVIKVIIFVVARLTVGAIL
jgi:hypothetical protein